MHTKSSERTVFSPTRQKSLLVPLSNFIIHLAAGEQLLNNEWPLVMECISFVLKGHKNRSDTTDHREQSLLFHGSSGVETHSHAVPRPFSATQTEKRDSRKNDLSTGICSRPIGTATDCK